MRKAITVLVCATLVSACGSDTEDKANNVNSANSQNSGQDAGAGDLSGDVSVVVDVGAEDAGALEDLGPSTPCLEVLNDEARVTIDPEGRSGQFYSEAAFDGRSVWVVYNRPESDAVSDEGVFVVRLLCDGTVAQGPIQLSESASGRRNYEPTIEAYDGLVHVVWVSQPNDANPKFVKWVGFRPDGSRINSVPKDITPSGAVDPVSETIWELDVAAYEGGGVVVAAALGEDKRVVAQRFDAVGDRVGEAFFPYEDKGVEQKRPTVAADGDGTLHIAWVRYVAADPMENVPEADDRAFMVRVPVGATQADGAPVPAQPLAAVNNTLRFAGSAASGGEHWLAFQSIANGRSDIIIRDGTDLSSVQTGVAGTMGWVNFRPNVAAGEAVGAVAYMRYNQSPVRNDVVVQPFAPASVGFDVGAPTVLVTDTSAIPPNGPGITHVGDDVFFLTWSQGARAPEARVQGRFVRLAMP